MVPKWPYFRLVKYYNLPIYTYIYTKYINIGTYRYIDTCILYVYTYIYIFNHRRYSWIVIVDRKPIGFTEEDVEKHVGRYGNIQKKVGNRSMEITPSTFEYD